MPFGPEFPEFPLGAGFSVLEGALESEEVASGSVVSGEVLVSEVGEGWESEVEGWVYVVVFGGGVDSVVTSLVTVSVSGSGAD